MIILQSKPKRGRTTELIKRFMEDKSPAILITDDMTPHGVEDIMRRLKLNGDNFNQDIAKSSIHVSPDYGCYRAAKSIANKNLYIDSHISRNEFENVKNQYKLLEKENGITVTISRQLPADSILEGVYVVEI